MFQSLHKRLPLPLTLSPCAPPFPLSSLLLLCNMVLKYCIVIVIISLFIRLQLHVRADLQAYRPSRNIDYAWEGLTMTSTGIPAGTGRVVILSTRRVRVRLTVLCYGYGSGSKDAVPADLYLQRMASLWLC